MRGGEFAGIISITALPAPEQHFCFWVSDGVTPGSQLCLLHAMSGDLAPGLPEALLSKHIFSLGHSM